MDDDLLRGLDWELEEIEDGDARELLFEAIEQYRSGDVDGALERLDRAALQAELEVVADDRVPAALMLMRAVCLGQLGRFDEALIVSERASELPDSGDPYVRILVSRSKNVHALLLAERGEREAAIRETTELAEELADDEDPMLREVATEACARRIRLLIELGRSDRAMSEWKALLARCDDPEESVRTEVALAGKNASIVLLQHKRLGAALAVADDVIARFGSATDAETRASVAVAISCRANVCRRRWRLFALYRAVQQFNEFVGPDPETEVVEAIRDAYPEKFARRMLGAARLYNS